MGDYKDWSFEQRDHQRCSFWNTTNYWHYAPPCCDNPPPFHPHKPPSGPPPPNQPRPPELCKQPLLHANKGPKNASGAFKCQGFPNPFLLYVLKELLFLSFHPLYSFTPLFMHRLIRTWGPPHWLLALFFFFLKGKNWFKPKLLLSLPNRVLIWDSLCSMASENTIIPNQLKSKLFWAKKRVQKKSIVYSQVYDLRKEACE